MLIRIKAVVGRVEECGIGVRIQIKVAHDLPDFPGFIYLDRPSREAKDFYVGQVFTLDLTHLSEEGNEK